MSSILVLGAGELGMEVLQALAAHPSILSTSATISVLLRPSTVAAAHDASDPRLARLRSLGVKLIAGDLAAGTVESLAALFQPYDTIISCTGFVAGPGTQIKLAQAAVRAGSKRAEGKLRYVPWQFGVDYDRVGAGSGQDLFDEQSEVRRVLREATRVDAPGIEWIIISTGVFMGFLISDGFGVCEGVVGSGKQDEKDASDQKGEITVRALGSWDTQVTATTVEDIGRLTASILLDPSEKPISNAVVFVAGETISYGRLAELVEQATTTPVRREEWPVDWLTRQLEKSPDDSLWKYRLAFASADGMAWEMGRTYNQMKGLETTDVKGWLRENVK